jgi:hypothetical protein
MSTILSSVPDPNEEEQTREERGRFQWLFEILKSVLPAIVLGVCLTPSLSTVYGNASLNLNDEVMHVDYALRLAGGSPPKYGDTLLLRTREIKVCAGTKFDFTRCQELAKGLPSKAFSFEAQQPFLGYVPYALFSKVFQKNIETPQKTIGQLRRVNAFWIALDVIIFGLICWRLRMPMVELLGGALFIGLNPLSTFGLSYVTNDAAALTGGLGTLLILVLAIENISSLSNRLWLPLFCGWGIILGLLKVTFLVVPLAIFGTLLFQFFRHRRFRKLLFLTGLEFLAGVSAALAYELWNTSRSPFSALAIEKSGLSFQSSPHIPFSTLGQSITWSLGLFQAQSPWFISVFMFICSGLVIAAIFRPIAVSEPVDILGRLAGSTVLVALLSAVGQTLFLWGIGHFNFATPVRYLEPLLPLFAVAAMWQLRENRPTSYLFSAFGIGSMCVFVGHF